MARIKKKNNQIKTIYCGLPESPGIYLFKDENQKIIYIGKAINLKNRVKNHFDDKNDDLRHKNLIFLVKKVDFQVVSSELEALLLEARLIKQYRPKYNSLLKDDKRYLYVGVSKEKFPKIYLLRKPEIEKNPADWFGPFPTASAIKEILRLLRRIFPYRSCKKLPAKPCLYHYLKLCPAPCINPAENYSQSIQKICLFLSGQIKPLIKLLTDQMKEAADKEAYEEAEILKRQAQMIEDLLARRPKSANQGRTEKQLQQLKNLLIRYQGYDPFLIHRLEAYDISNLGKEIIVGSMVAFTNGEPETDQYRQFKILNQGQDDFGSLKQVVLRRLNHQEWVLPQVILIDGGKGQVSAVFEALKEKRLVGKIGLLGLTKEKETIVVPRIQENRIRAWKKLLYSRSSPALQLLQQLRDESHRFAQRYYKKVHQKKTLNF